MIIMLGNYVLKTFISEKYCSYSLMYLLLDLTAVIQVTPRTIFLHQRGCKSHVLSIKKGKFMSEHMLQNGYHGSL